MEATLVLEALVQGYLQERFPQAAEALHKELDSRGTDQQAAVVAPKDRQALLTLLAEANGDGEPMWATSYAETRDWIDGALDSYKVRRGSCHDPPAPTPLLAACHGRRGRRWRRLTSLPWSAFSRSSSGCSTRCLRTHTSSFCRRASAATLASSSSGSTGTTR